MEEKEVYNVNVSMEQLEKYIEAKANEKILSFSTGGSTRQWAKRYGKMKSKYEILKQIKASEDILLGYRICMETFEGSV